MNRALKHTNGTWRGFGLLVRLGLINAWRRVLSVRQQSPVLVGLIVCFIFGYLCIAYQLFCKAFRFLNAFPGLGQAIVERIMFVLFAFLFGLLVVSNTIVLYTNLFRNPEVQWLLSTPVPPRSIFMAKLLEGVLYASWAFVFLISPMLAAYGRTMNAGWGFYAGSVAAVALFIVLPGVIGAWLALEIALHVDRRVFRALCVLVLCTCLVGLVWVWRAAPVTEETLEARVMPALDQLLGRTRFAHVPVLPSYWLGSCVLYWAEGALKSAAFYLGLTFSYALFFGMIAHSWLGGRFQRAYQVAHGRGGELRLIPQLGMTGGGTARMRGEVSHGRLESIVARLVPLGPDARALLVKDLRLFWRDTAQWTQSLMLFGLFWVYVINLPRVSSQLGGPFWNALVLHLNLLACALYLATITTRFVYPQLSLEGHAAWIITLAPMGLSGAVRTKLVAACTGSVLVSVSLILASALALRLEWHRVLYFVSVAALMAITLAALAMGLAMLCPNFKETNPGKIVNGLGGSLCLILSCLYILGAVLVLALGSSDLFFGRPAVLSGPTSMLSFLAVSGLFGWVPLRLGYRALARLEL